MNVPHDRSNLHVSAHAGTHCNCVSDLRNQTRHWTENIRQRSTLHDLLETDNSIGIAEPIAVIIPCIYNTTEMTYTDYIYIHVHG